MIWERDFTKPGTWLVTAQMEHQFLGRIDYQVKLGVS